MVTRRKAKGADQKKKLIVKPVMEGQLGTFPRDIAVTYAVFCMSLSSMVKQPTAGTLSWRFIQLASGKIPKANMVSRLCITRLVVAGLGFHFLASGPLGVLPGSSSLWATQGLLPSWNVLLDVRPCCARMCMNCSCCEMNVCSKTLASASTLTCNL